MGLGGSSPRRLRFASLILAIFLYGVFGTPTPDQPGFKEGLIALLLMGAVGTAAALRPLGIGLTLPSGLAGGQALLLYGLFSPVIAGALHGNDLAAILRDLIPFLFFLMPLFCAELVEDVRAQRLLIVASVFVGLAFSVRDLARIMTGFGSLDFLSPLAADPLSYLANAPTVLFAGLILLGSAGRLAFAGVSARDFSKACLFLILTLAPFIVMALTLQRASIGLAALIGFIWLGVAFAVNPFRALRLMIPLALILLAGLPYFQDILSLMLQKTQNVGLNSRVEEAAAIWRLVSGNPLSLLFGLGWGAGFASPAVGGLSVHFAHSLPAAMLLKTGLVGVTLTVIYLLGFARVLLRLMGRDLVLALALAAPLAIDSILYAAYKSLDFGLILLILWAVSVPKTASELQS